MKCLYPVRFYRDDKGNISHDANKIKIASEGFRPCQYCINCRLRRAESNAIRMIHETQFHDQSCFLTLTYSEENLPPSGSLDYTHVTNFLKRLRKKLNSKNLSYYRVGEYGDNFSRPHYHMVLFGYDFSDPISYNGTLNRKTLTPTAGDHKYYKSDFATDCWSHGFVDIGDVDYATCMYTAKYVTKKLYGSDAKKYGTKLSECASSSKGFTYPKFKKYPKNHPLYKSVPHPLAGTRTSSAIGKRWIEKYYADVYPHDYVVHNGKKLTPPRYYDEWCETNQPSLWEETKSNREKNMCEMYPDYYDLHAKHVKRIQRQSQFLRDGCAPNLSLDNELINRESERLTLISQGKL